MGYLGLTPYHLVSGMFERISVEHLDKIMMENPVSRKLFLNKENCALFSAAIRR